MTWPFENDTSAIVKKLAGRSMQADKRNKAFLLLTIAISRLYGFFDSPNINRHTREIQEHTEK
ncbi:MAG: hypothetical protein ACLRZZ_03750 [Enterocloster sp.]